MLATRSIESKRISTRGFQPGDFTTFPSTKFGPKMKSLMVVIYLLERISFSAKSGFEISNLKSPV